MNSGSVPSPLAAAPPPPPPPPPPPSVEDPTPAMAMPAPSAEAPKLFVTAGVPPTVFTLRPGALIVGRLAESDFQLDHPEISRYHCRLHWDGQNPGLEDLGSRRGTKLNGALLPKGTIAPLRPGDKIEVGPVVLMFSPNAPPAVAAGPKTGDPATVGSSIPRATMGGRETAVIPLADRKLTLGRATECDVVLSDSGVSRQHLSIERGASGYLVTDLRSRGGSFVNGHRFERHELVIGDQVQLGPFYFRFDGRQLVRTRGGAGVTIETQQLTKVVETDKGKSLTILDAVTARVERGQFICILGPSGSGKSTLLNALTGLQPATSGQVLYDGADLVREYDSLRSLLGYVPQDDIVHPELTVREALLYAAQLRLPEGTPPHEITKLVTQTIHQLGLDGAGDPRYDRTNTPIHRLSGGQRKRVSVGVELLGRPSVLFLDEPTSGLDPAAEFKMMELLRHLADGGCTVVCTTHLMENAFLADKIFVVAQGKLVFAGGPQEAREHFGVQKLHALFDRLAERSAVEWQRDFQRAEMEKHLQTVPPGGLAGASGQLAIAPPPAAPPPPALPILMRRQWRILTSDLKNFLILFGQPIVIGGLVSWVAKESSLCLFFAYLSALWFGCSNAAQEIVKEIAIYRRERMVGLGRHGYLLSKFFLVGALTAAQTLLLYLVMQLGHFALHTYQVPAAISYDPAPPVHEFLMGKMGWQVIALVCTSLAAVGVGLAISALSRTAMQAVMIVPLALIPQILFSGVVVLPRDMKEPVYALTQAFPSYAAQTIMDLSCFDGQEIEPKIIDKHQLGYDHVFFLHKRDTGQRLGTGDVYRAGTRPLRSTGVLVVWALLGYGVAWFALRLRERG